MKSILKIKDYLLDGDYLKDLSKLVSGTMIANIIPLIISPILARLYAPEAFGIYGLYISIVNIATIAFTGRYELAIFLAKSRGEALDLLNLSTIIGIVLIVVGYLAIVILVIFSPEITASSHLWIWAVPITAFLIAVNRTLVNYSSYLRDYRNVAINKVSKSLNVGLFKTLLYTLSKGIGLILGNLLGIFITVMSYGALLYRKRHFIFHRLSLQSILSAGRNHKNFFRFDLISAIFNAISINIPIIILSAYYEESLVGQFSMAFTILNLPMMLIGSSIGQIYYERISKIESKAQIAIFTNKIIRQLALMGSVVMIILVFGDTIFSFVLGERWTQAGVFAQYMAPYVYLVFIAAPISQIYARYSIQKRVLNFNIVLLSSRALIMFSSIYLLKDIDHVVLLFSVSGLITYFIFFIRELRIVGLPFRANSIVILSPLMIGMLILLLRQLITTGL